MTSMFSLSGKVAVVTGGTSGLGLAIAKSIAACGASSLVLVSRQQSKVDEASQLIKSESPDCIVHGIAADVADEKSVDALFAQLRTLLPHGLDLLVTAAGIINRTPAMEDTMDSFDRVFRTNFYGTFMCCQRAGRWMRECGRGGAILCIASLSAHVALSDVASYACSKAAVVQLVKQLANDWAQYHIRVNALSPGWFPTDINRAAISGTPRGEWALKQTPEGRFGQAEELAGAAVYLLSDAASFTTGSILAVDGGFLARGVGPTVAQPAL